MLRLLRNLIVCIVWTGVALAQTPRASAVPEPVLEEGEIDGARFAIARPSTPWNGQVLLLAHGYRGEEAPLVADLFVGHGAYAALLNEGWIVAKTSYRRNGIIVADAIKDLDALRAYIARRDGEPKRVLLEGESMGGMIVTLLAERGDGAYAGAVAIGAALDIREPNGVSGVSFRPRIPLLFLTNQSELAGPRGYVDRTRAEAVLDRGGVVAAALFRVSRDGHVNVNQAERLIALRSLTVWLGQGAAALPASAFEPKSAGAELTGFEATVAPAPQPSQVTLDADHRGFISTVVEISAIYGNVWLNAQPADFEAAGIAPGSYFQLITGRGTFRARYGRDFSSVPKGDWVAFPNADGFFWLAKNFSNAASAAGLTVGGTVQLRRYDEP